MTSRVDQPSPFRRISLPAYTRWDLTPEEWRNELRGVRGIQNRREMARSPYGAAISRASALVYRRLTWRAETSGTSASDKAAVEFLESCLKDLNVPWSDFINQAVVNMFEQGYALFEHSYKKRGGEQPDDGEIPSSKYDDNRIGWWAFDIITADTIVDDWDIPAGRSWQGVFQTASYGGRVYIPKVKSLLFRLDNRTGSPVGAGGIFDDAYRAWYYLTNLQRIQGIIIERMGGVPKIKLGPGATWDDTPGSDYYLARQAIERFRADEQMGFVVPDGYDVEIMSPGEGAADIQGAIEAYKRDFFLAALAQWAMLGADKVGSYALSKDQSDFFVMALAGWLNGIVQVLNEIAVPRLFKLNAFNGVTEYPRLVHDPITDRDGLDFADALQKFAADLWINPQPEDEEYLRRKLGLPERLAEDIKREREEQAVETPPPAPAVSPATGFSRLDALRRELAATRMTLAETLDRTAL